MANATQIHQVIINLCSNAADAMLESGGTLSILMTKATLDHPLVCNLARISPGAYIKLEISDTGKGMASGTIERIFEPYFTTKEIGKGTGLGLSVAHGIMERHKGHIMVASEPEKGTVFTIFLPVYSGRMDIETGQPSETPTGTEKILLVDDESAIMQLEKRQLSRLGYEVVGTNDPLKALELFRDDPKRFDLVITDMAMPKMTGDQLAEAIKEIQPQMPVILCTGYSEKISEEKAFENGISAIVMKPIAKNDFAVCVRNVLNQATLSQEG
jgi:CheY-like chemotaxis protein